MHWTYSEAMDASSLHQGDVIRRTADIEDVLKAIHPHYFAHSGYRFFQVLTQSCDLVRRGQPCKSPYITIAAVRPVARAVRRFTERLQYDELERRLGFCSSERRPKVNHFVESLLDNNVDSYFYLYAQPTAGLGEDHVTFLQLSVPLKSAEHYDRLLGGKILQLSEPFEHKLGYLVGSSYSKVGTKDWPREKEYKTLTSHHVSAADEVLWLDRTVHRSVIKGLSKLPDNEVTLEKLKELIAAAGNSAEQNRSKVFKIIEDVARGAGTTEKHIESTILRLQNNATFRSLIAG